MVKKVIKKCQKKRHKNVLKNRKSFFQKSHKNGQKILLFCQKNHLLVKKGHKKVTQSKKFSKKVVKTVKKSFYFFKKVIFWSKKS